MAAFVSRATSAMLIESYYRENNGIISFTRQQGSDFAKNIADDFNPLHDIDAKRFCIPGDLLFSLVLAKYGISQHMQFTFSGMVTEQSLLNLPSDSEALHIKDTQDKEYLSIKKSGASSHNSDFIDSLTRSYVTFSGHTFPHILQPLLQQQQVMINPDRPMVIYESMLIDLDRLDINSVDLQINKDKTRFDLNGKRGNVCLAFTLIADSEEVGRGEKNMVLSGLKPYQQDVVDSLVTGYNERKASYRDR